MIDTAAPQDAQLVAGSHPPEMVIRSDSINDVSAAMERQLAMELERRETQDLVSSRFTVSDLVRNPTLAQAAWAELEGRQGSQVGSSSGANKAGGELARQKGMVAGIDSDAREESRINQEMARLAVARLDASRCSLTKLHKLLQILAQSERSHSNALLSVAKIALSCENDGKAMRDLNNATCAFPGATAQLHGENCATLLACMDAVASTSDAYRQAASSLSQSLKSVTEKLEKRRAGMHEALAVHETACMAIDHTRQQKEKGHVIWAPDMDPWSTEATLVAAQIHMLEAQQSERLLVAWSFKQLEQLERERMKCITESVEGLLRTYSAPNQSKAQALKDQVQRMDINSHLQPLLEAAASAKKACSQMEEKKSQIISALVHDLYCSPEIVQQGDMQRWNAISSQWHDCHCVLTRCGFLHTCQSAKAEDVKPVESVALAKCQFEGSNATAFNISEDSFARMTWFGGKSRKFTFRTENVEDCCEWTMLIRDLIATWNGKGIQSPVFP